MTTTYELYTNENGTPKAVEGKAPAILERVEALETSVETLEGTLDNGVVTSVNGNTGDITPEQTGCLPTGGGKLMGAIKLNTSTLVNRSVDNSNLQINGGSGWGKGASIELYGKSRSNDAGAFKVRTTDGTNTADFMVMPNGTAKIKGYPLEHVISQGGGYIRYSSGLQICYLGFSIPNGASSVVVTYPIAFSSVPAVSMGIAGTGSAFMYYKNTTTTSVTMNRTGTSGVFSGSCVVVGKWN